MSYLCEKHLSQAVVLLVLLALLSKFANASFPHAPLLDAAKKLNGKNLPLVILYPDGSLPNIQPIAKKFTDLTGINISFEKTSVDDINTKMLLGAVQKFSNYDIALPATFGIPDLVEAGALLDVSEFAAKYEPLVAYSPSLYSLGDSYKGKKYGYQTDGDSYVMFYNKAWLENKEEQQRYQAIFKRQLSIAKTWQELDEQMAFFHRPDKDMYGGCMFRLPRYMVWEWWIRFHAKGVYPVDDTMRPNIAEAAGVKALQEMIRASMHQHPSVKTNGLFDNWAEYAKGHCFANIGWGGTQKHLNSGSSSIIGKLTHAPTPGVSYFNWGWNYVVSSYSKQAELAYLFTLFATLPETSLVAVRGNGFFDPYRSEHYTDKKIMETYTASFLEAHHKAMIQAIPDFYLEGQGRYMQALQEAIVSAHEGDVSAEEALAYAANKWEEITDSIGRKKQISQWTKLKQKYPK